MKGHSELAGKPVLLVILDGFGLNPATEFNAVKLANTPNFDRYFSSYSMAALEASGRGVGLPLGQMGNSEVGHMTLGSGCIVKQDLVRIDDSIKDGSFFSNQALCEAVELASNQQRPLHLIGLVSDGGVHSHIDHVKALIKLCELKGARPNLHMITDGRDTAPEVAVEYLSDLEKALAAAQGQISTVIGRYFAMDRDNRWDRVKKAWDAMFNAGSRSAVTVMDALQEQYQEGIQDEFIQPVFIEGGHAIQYGDPIILFNFRNDRVRQLARALNNKTFDGFERGQGFEPLSITCMTLYEEKLGAPIAFQPQRPETTLSAIVSQSGFRQLHCSETEKYPHVTFFFNGGKEEPYEGEDRELINSPRVATYDLQPEMSAAEVAEVMKLALHSMQYSFLVVNFANGDMVGHTAVQCAIIKAVEVLDKEVGEVLDQALSLGYSIILTADHGNCDEMVDPVTGKPHTQHSQHPVPCLVIDDRVVTLRDKGNLSAVAPTVLELMGLDQPVSMTGQSLILTL
ncbi:MAG: 2,3-bisphosphoglycerate-independent phosphoglycerate mutase [Gammaproteobacteria bacterium]|jgi:2,3-bisphosphoglycerate-independent phosphoglycerate mutase